MIARSGYRFWQPFRGGVAFIATQAAGWALFSLAAAFMIWTVIQLAQGMAYCVQCWALMTGATMFAAQLLLGVSVLTYKGAPGKVLETVANPHTGAREWGLVVGLYQRYMLASLQWWFGNVEVVKHGQTGFSPHQRYLLGYSPHGLFPIGAAYLQFLPTFRAIAGPMRTATVVASAIFYPPVIRDICSWCGLRVVARRTIIRALKDKGAVILVPGGQAELVLTWRMFRQNPRGKREYVVYTRHKGFIKLAIEQQAHLVPILVLGEICSLRNFIDIPALQQWTYKKIGFPVPYLVVGWGGCTPLPMAGRGLRFIIGEPIQPPLLEPGQQVRSLAKCSEVPWRIVDGPGH
ncbi:hypothetical protein WJX84_011356 [Apatococcus fuscideae]|uniref:Acyltransferase n=1 Tax=Apatococcus fuscideae TaxID=2026836 RepID=A0AAW1SUP2_9CHLO